MLAHHGEIELQGTLEEAEASVPEGMFIKKGGTKEAPQYTLCYHMHSGTIDGRYVNMSSTGEGTIVDEGDKEYKFKISDIDMSDPKESLKKII